LRGREGRVVKRLGFLRFLKLVGLGLYMYSVEFASDADGMDG
jgi:hypothetical protein